MEEQNETQPKIHNKYFFCIPFNSSMDVFGHVSMFYSGLCSS